MRKAGAIAGATGSDFQKMRDSALELGASTTQTSSQVAEAMTELAAKGFDANQVIAAMPGIIAAAEASGEDLALTSDTITSALNAFNMKASESGRVADVLAMTANKSAAGMTSLQYAFKYAAGPHGAARHIIGGTCGRYGDNGRCWTRGRAGGYDATICFTSAS